MLSFNKSDRAIAMIKGGEHKGKIVYYHEKEDPALKMNVPLDRYLKGDMFKTGRNYASEKNMNMMIDAIARGYLPEIADEELLAMYASNRDSAVKRNFKELSLNDGEFVILPYEQPNQVEIVYITGPKGSGKSTFCRKYGDTYKAYFPENRCFLISRKEEDEVLDTAGYITRINVDDSFLEGNPLGPADFKDSLVIFDDIESIGNKKLKEAVYQLKKDLMMTGRSDNVYVLSVSHITCGGNDTRVDLTEADGYVTFDNCSAHHLKRLLSVYGGLDNPTIRRVQDMKSRWVFTHRSRPRYIIGERDIILL